MFIFRLVTFFIFFFNHFLELTHCQIKLMELFLSVSFRKKNWDDFCSIFLPLSPEEWCVFSLRMIMGRESANTGRNLAFLRK